MPGSVHGNYIIKTEEKLRTLPIIKSRISFSIRCRVDKSTAAVSSTLRNESFAGIMRMKGNYSKDSQERHKIGYSKARLQQGQELRA